MSNQPNPVEVAERLRRYAGSDMYIDTAEGDLFDLARQAILSQAGEIERLRELLVKDDAEAIQQIMKSNAAWTEALSASQSRAERLETALRDVCEEARRYAGFYPEASDGRNTFIIFAEWAEARAVLQPGGEG